MGTEFSSVSFFILYDLGGHDVVVKLSGTWVGRKERHNAEILS